MTGLNGPGGEAVFVIASESVCPLGLGRRQILESLVAGRLAGDRVSRFDASLLPVDGAAEVRSDLSDLLAFWGDEELAVAQFDRKLELALACAALASDEFMPLLSLAEPGRRGIVLGVGLDVSPLERTSEAMMRAGPVTTDVEALAQVNVLRPGMGKLFNLTDLGTLLLARHFGCGAFQMSVLTACSASSQAIGIGFDAIRTGRADVVIVGGMDSLLNLPAFAAFAKLGVIQPCRDGPAAACKPCDRGRRGTLLGEGAGLSILASRTFVEGNMVPPRTELLGYGSTLDGHHITAPDPTGSGMRRAMREAMSCAGIGPEEIDYVNLHGTGTRANDQVELTALVDVLGEHAPRVAASSTKDRHGHLIAAAGIMEAIVVELSIRHDLVPCTVNLSKPVMTDGVDLVMESNRSARLNVCMSNSFAFGGINTSLIFRRVEA